jgi:hypothetical protein
MNAALQRCANAPGQCAPLQLRAGCPAALPAHAGPCFLGRVLVQGPVCLRGVQRVAAAETSTSSLLSGVPLDRGVTVSSEPAAAGAGLDGVPLESEVRAAPVLGGPARPRGRLRAAAAPCPLQR